MRVIVVDQNDDSRLDAVVTGRTFPIQRTRGPLGLSRARNTGLALVEADLVAFPDDDCVYPPGLLERVAARLGPDSGLAGLTGRAEDASGRSAASWQDEGAILTDDNLWNRAISFTIFLRRSIAEAVGSFDEELGLGSGSPWTSGEEIDYLVRAVRAGASIEYDPSLVVVHDVRADEVDVGARDGASIGYLLRKHGYPPASRVADARPATRRHDRLLATPRRCARQVLPRDVSWPHPRLPGREALEQLCVTVEPGRERELLDGTPPSRGGDTPTDRPGRGSGRPPTPPEPVDRHARTRPDGARRCRPRRPPAPGRPRCGHRRPVARTPSPRSRDWGMGR